MENKSEKWHGLHAETGAIAWKDLERFFAKGNLLRISPELDLVDTAYEISSDNKEAIEQWLVDGKVAGVSAEEATLWSQGEIELWSVVVLPWILVQQRS